MHARGDYAEKQERCRWDWQLSSSQCDYDGRSRDLPKLRNCSISSCDMIQIGAISFPVASAATVSYAGLWLHHCHVFKKTEGGDNCSAKIISLSR